MSNTSSHEAASADLAVLIGRFQPFHAGHLDLVRQGLNSAPRLLIVIGSAEAARRPDTLPFSADERRDMISAALGGTDRARVRFAAVPDYGDVRRWADAVRAEVGWAAQQWGLGEDAAVRLLGCHKDRSSAYLNAFPGWDLQAMEPQRDGLSATGLREIYFGQDQAAIEALLGDGDGRLPRDVAGWLETFRATDTYRDLAEEWAFALRYRAAWSAAPYPPVFVTADAVVVHRGEVLLIQRKARPGKGLWALPGGFLEQDEYLVDAAMRELTEETGFGMDPDLLRRSMKGTRVFDDPRRDIRGRTITHASLFHLPDDAQRPDVAAADDAADTRWAPLDALQGAALFGDHYQIIRSFSGLLDDA